VKPVVVRRSAMRMWTMAIGGIPLVILGVDVLTQRRITNALRDLLFRPEDTQIFEARDVIWAIVILGVGLLFAIWGVKELLFPSLVFRADDSGIALNVRGPFQPAVLVPWQFVDDIGTGTVDDEGAYLEVLWLRFLPGHRVPAEPWGSRWLERSTLALLSGDWEIPPSEVVDSVIDLALESARTGAIEPEIEQ